MRRLGFLLWTAAALLASGELPKGQIIEKVPCQAGESHSYALYLPAAYTPQRQWPILYCLDPGARGRVPVERFQQAAETYGFILAGSNTSRNGPWEPTVAAMTALWQDTHARFAIDPARTYITGFSGGARAAAMFGLNQGLFAGVIGAGAGFPGKVPASIPFAWFGTAGAEDFNYPEVKRIHEMLALAGQTSRFVAFDGGHDWPPAAVCAEAVEWLELEAMKASRRPRDPALVRALLDKRLAAIRALESSERSGAAYAEYAALAADFRGLADVAEFEQEAARRKDSREARAYLKRESREETDQQRLTAEFQAARQELNNPERALRSRIEALQRKARAEADSSDRRVARRVLIGEYIRCGEETRALLGDKQYGRAAVLLELAATLRPDRPRIFYELARAYALAGDRGKALAALRKAAEMGFRDSALVGRDAAFDRLRGEPGFAGVLALMAAKP